MKYENYYETLTPMQKLKWEEKKGPIIYKDWFEMISKNLDLETSGALLLAILFYDCTGGAKDIPKKYMSVLKKNPTAMVLLDTYIPATAAATRQWINRHRLSKKDEELEEDAVLNKIAMDYAKKVASTESKRSAKKSAKKETIEKELKYVPIETVSTFDEEPSVEDYDDLPF